MATETVASDHTSATDEQIVKKEKSEAIAQMIASLANEDEDKHDKPGDAQCQPTPSSKTAGEAEGDETKTEPAAVQVDKSDDSPSLEASAEDNSIHDKVEDAQTPAAPFSKTEGEAEEDEKEAEPVVVAVEKTDDPVSLEANVADNLKEEKELIPDSQTISVAAETAHDAAKSEPELPPSTETTVKESPQQVEKESTETEEKEQSKTADIPVASAETIEKSSNTAGANPLMESEAKVEKEAEILEASAGKEEMTEPEPLATEVQEKTEEPEKESQEKPQEAEQPGTVAIPEPSAEANEKPSHAIEEDKTREPSAEVLKETNDNEARPTEAVKAEPVVTEVEENPKEPEKQSLEQKEEEQPNMIAIPEVPSIETSEAIEEKTRDSEFEKEVEKETKHETEHTETEKAEPVVVTKVDENTSETEKQSFKQEEEEQPKTVIPETPETEAKSAEKPDDIVEAHPPKESDIEVVKEISNSESEAVPGKAENPDDTVVVKPPQESDIEVVKGISNSEAETVPEKEEKPEPLSTEVEEKPRELVEVVEKVGETSKELETKHEIVPEATKIEGTSDDTIKEQISLKEEKSDKEEVTNIPENTAQVSLNEKDQEAPANVVETSTEIAEKIVEEDGKKEPSFNDVIEGVSKEVAGVIKNPEQASIDHEAKTDLKEEREYSAPTNVVEKVAVAAANDDKTVPDAPEAVQVSSREAEVGIKKVEEQIEAKAATTEAGVLKVEGVEGDRPAVDSKKEEKADTKADEISSAVSEPVRETLASKFEEESAKTGGDTSEKEQTEEPVKTEAQVPEPPTKESDATKTSKVGPKETPAKPAQKQSNNIISKVKQSLVKAKKAITGKSPSSKNLSSEAKDDIKVK